MGWGLKGCQVGPIAHVCLGRDLFLLSPCIRYAIYLRHPVQANTGLRLVLYWLVLAHHGILDVVLRNGQLTRLALLLGLGVQLL